MESIQEAEVERCHLATDPWRTCRDRESVDYSAASSGFLHHVLLKILIKSQKQFIYLEVLSRVNTFKYIISKMRVAFITYFYYIIIVWHHEPHFTILAACKRIHKYDETCLWWNHYIVWSRAGQSAMCPVYMCNANPYQKHKCTQI